MGLLTRFQHALNQAGSGGVKAGERANAGKEAGSKAEEGAGAEVEAGS